MKSRVLISILLFLNFSLYAEVEVHVDGTVHKGRDVEYSSGKINLFIGKGKATRGFSIDQVQKIVRPMSSMANNMWDRFIEGKYSLVASEAGATLVENEKFLGWGKRISFAHAYSLFKIGKTKEAQSVLNGVSFYTKGGENELDDQLISITTAAIELSHNRDAAAEKKLQSLVTKLLPEAKAYFYNLEGDLFLKKGEANMAILSYYKALLLDKTNAHERNYAKSQIQGIYKKLQDPRAEEIDSLN